MLNLSYVNILFPDLISALFAIFFSALDVFVVTNNDRNKGMLCECVIAMIFEKFKDTLDSKTLRFLEGATVGTIILGPSISKGICQGLSSWYLPGQIWAWQIICPYRCIRVKLRSDHQKMVFIHFFCKK